MSEVLDRPTTRLTLRKIGNSQGVTFPKTILDGLDFSHGIEVERVAGELRLRPASDHDDPFGFGAAVRHRIETNTLDPLQIPDVLPEDGDF